MKKVRICTFNCENLFARYNFNQGVSPPKDGFTVNDLSFDLYDNRAKRITGKAIRETDADIVCLQEVDNLPVLDRFNNEFLGAPTAKRYRHRVLIDGNDPRHIDVAVLSRYPIRSLRTHRHDRNISNTAALFSRDCLRVEIDVGDGAVLPIYINHFKSMMGGRRATRPRRVEQADGMMEILRRDWGNDLKGQFAVVGDLNDYPETDPDGTETALGSLLDSPALVNPLKRLAKKDRWTHYFARERAYRQLDYILLSAELDQASGEPKPTRVLDGLPWRADRYEGPRFEDVGEDHPKASDHVPLVIDVKVG